MTGANDMAGGAATVTAVVVVGGGTAGWLSACRIAAERPDLSVTLIESPDIPTIGVGEGTWPTMRRTLARIGIGEAEFLLACDASFKQGSRFDGWATGAPGDTYLHPFAPPVDADPRDLVATWQSAFADRSFADAVGPQPAACALDLAPRQRAMPDYAGALNYGYHLDAGKLATLLRRHATQRLGVRHIADRVVGIDAAGNGDVIAVRTRDNGPVPGDLFIDCTGHAALLIGGHCGVPLIDRTDILFNDRALAVQVPVAPDSPIASQTVATAHPAGWIWDIGLPTRRGVGCVYASAFMSDDEAGAVLSGYLGVRDPAFRKLEFRSAHRERFWHGNCLAIGLSAGFLEPLEASAIVTIELSLDRLLDGFPANRDIMMSHARRFDALFVYRWDRIVDFLKLHYLLSRRPEPYWRAHRDPAGVPDRLAELLEIWRYQPPSAADLPMLDEVFPAASYQYVLYGMENRLPPLKKSSDSAHLAMQQGLLRGRSLAAGLPTNRQYFNTLHASERRAE